MDQSGSLSHQLGFDGFGWLICVVESLDDPM